MKDNYITGVLQVKNAVSDIKLKAEFERRLVSMSVRVMPPLPKGSIAKVSWIGRQLEYCKKKNPNSFRKMEENIWIEANIKFAKNNLF